MRRERQETDRQGIDGMGGGMEFDIPYRIREVMEGASMKERIKLTYLELMVILSIVLVISIAVWAIVRCF